MIRHKSTVSQQSGSSQAAVRQQSGSSQSVVSQQLVKFGWICLDLVKFGKKKIFWKIESKQKSVWHRKVLECVSG